MKYTGLLLLFLFQFCTIMAQEENGEGSYETQQFESDLKGKVSHVHTTYLFSETGASQDTASYILIDKYNRNGLRIEQQMLSLDNTLIGAVNLELNSQGLVSKADYTDMYGNLVTRVVYSYDNSGNCIQVNVYRGAFYPKSQITYKYNAQNAPVEITKYNSFNFPVEKEELIYDNKGYNTLKRFFDGRNKLKYTITLQYDSAGHVTSYTRTGKNNEITETYNASLDSVGNINNSETKQFAPGGTIDTVTKYDRYGNPVSITITDPNNISPAISLIGYRYDKQGNWTQKQITEKGIVTSQATRTIDYYE
ncbi:hypothetical protein [Coprobacter tertius]|uniref:YD repeat-containing protein n=1 Tax=Coprobacter tertius TaxID=2944915 RepID=A0ABT1MES8_9BACT|nr:hypothetical protein [Coprobacter tertius]MCP9611133.1 hypothetical protein [Coprobacter tertius]